MAYEASKKGMAVMKVNSIASVSVTVVLLQGGNANPKPDPSPTIGQICTV